MVLTVVGGAMVAPQKTVEADAPTSGTYVMLPVVQNGDGVTSLIAIQNTNPFVERFLVTFYPSGKQFLTGTVYPKASYLIPNSVIPDGISSATVETIAYIQTFTAVAPEFANIPVFFPPAFALSTSISAIGGPQQLILGVGLDVAVRNFQTNGGVVVTGLSLTEAAPAYDLCANGDFAAFTGTFFPQFPCRNFFTGATVNTGVLASGGNSFTNTGGVVVAGSGNTPGAVSPNGQTPTGFVWSYVIDVTNTEYLYITSASTGAVAGYFTGTYSKLSDFLGVPGFDILSPGAAVVVHRTDQTGPRVAEYEGIPFSRSAYSSTTPPGPGPLGTSSIAGAYNATGNVNNFGQITGVGTGFIGSFGYTVFAPLVMHNYHGWNTHVWFMNYNRNNEMVITYYDQAGNPVFEENGYALGTGRTTAVTGAGLPDGFVGTAWIATTRYNAIVVDEIRDNPPMLMSYRGEASRVALALDTLSGITGNYNNFQPVLPAGTIGNFSGTAAFASAPLILSRYHGWNTGIALLNPNAFEVRVTLNFRRENGGEQYVVSDRIPPRAMTPFYDAAWSNLPENFVGNVQIQGEYSPGIPAGLVGIVNEVNYIRGMAMAYNTVDNVFDLAGENDLPFITKGFQGYNSGTAIANMNINPGVASGNFDVYTATGILERTIWQVDSLNTATVYMPNMYQVPNGFVGGAAAYIVQTNQAPAPVYGQAAPIFPTGIGGSVGGIGLSNQSNYVGTGLVNPILTTGIQSLAQGTGISTVVNNVNYNGTGDTGASYGGFPVGGVFTGVGLGGYGAGGIVGLVKNCNVGTATPGHPFFVWSGPLGPQGAPPGLFLNGVVPVNAANTCQSAAQVLPFNPALQQVVGTGGIPGTAIGNVGVLSGNANGSTTISGTITSFIPATPAQTGALNITTSNGQVLSFVIPAGTPLSQFPAAGLNGPVSTSTQNITQGLTGQFVLSLVNGQLAGLSAALNPTFGTNFGNTSLPGTFRNGLAFTAGSLGAAAVTFTDQNGDWAVNGLPPGEYFFEVGGFSAACASIGATGTGALTQDTTFSYVAFRNSEVEKIVVNGNNVETAPTVCMSPVGPVYEIGVVTSAAGPVNGATVCAETICPSFNGVFPAGLGAPTSLGGLTAAGTAGSVLNAGVSAYGILTTSGTSLQSLTGTNIVATLPFCSVTGLGINVPASGTTVVGPGNVTVPGTTFSVGPNQGGYVLTLPWFGNYKKTVTVPGQAAQVFLATDCAQVNIVNLSVSGNTATTGTQAPSPAPGLTAVEGTTAGEIIFTVSPTSTNGVSVTNVLIYEVISGTNSLKASVANPTGGTANLTQVVGGFAPGTGHVFIAQSQSVSGTLSTFSTPIVVNASQVGTVPQTPGTVLSAGTATTVATGQANVTVSLPANVAGATSYVALTYTDAAGSIIQSVNIPTGGANPVQAVFTTNNGLGIALASGTTIYVQAAAFNAAGTQLAIGSNTFSTTVR